jgi:hypothetical protein
MGGVCLSIISDRIACGSWNEECWSYGVFLMVMTNSMGRLDQTGTNDLEDLL